MIGVAIPAHDEARLIGDCLQAVRDASTHPALAGEPVLVVVALDRCGDATADIAAHHGATTLAIDCGNVGEARRAATEALLASGVRWIASTDADTRVPPDWLAAQLDLACDMFLGIVQVDDWHGYHPRMSTAFGRSEAVQVGHPHIHGANMGFSADAYRRSGGYGPLALSEDVALVDAFIASGARIARQPCPVVTTSARKHARAAGGFSDYLREMNRRLWLEDTGGAEPALAGAP